MAWNTSASSRKKYSVVTDKRVTQETRPGKYATMATAPSGRVFAALVLIPMLLVSMVTKPEPGLKQRVLAAVRLFEISRGQQGNGKES